MLKGLFQSREEKIRQKIDDHIAEGMTHLASKFYNGAMIEFDKAMELDSKAVYPRLVEELSTAAAGGELESALAIGLNLIKKNNQDFELANKLGNYARELKDYNQANNLYRTALKIKKNYDLAFYNFAASQAKVNIYDEAVKSAVGQFDTVDRYVLPEFIGEENLIETFTEKANENKQTRFKQKLEELTIERDKLIEEGGTIEAQGIDLKIKNLKESSVTTAFEDVSEEFRREIADDPENEKSHKFNLALYSIQSNNPDMALEALDGLTNRDFDTVELLRAIAIEQKGHLGKAINNLQQLLGKNEYHRYYNVNIGLMYRRAKKQFIATKYLIKTAALLEKSGGIYSMQVLLHEADEAYEQGRLKKALNYYQIAASEIPNAEIWLKIGTIFVERKKYDEAVEAFREMSKLNPDSHVADSKLREIHDYYVDRAETLFTDGKYKPAVDYFHKALGVLRLPETVKRTAETYKQLNNSEREQEFLDEWQQLMAAKKERDQEEHRQKMIQKGKTYLKEKKYIQAIDSFEKILRMKVDKTIFVQLATLYKALKKNNDLADLEERWAKMLAHDEKLKRYEKEKEREQQSKDASEEPDDRMTE
jgi:tetratricopeptide (TPR) repeat protein